MEYGVWSEADGLEVGITGRSKVKSKIGLDFYAKVEDLCAELLES
jgi:hypothetical protein